MLSDFEFNKVQKLKTIAICGWASAAICSVIGSVAIINGVAKTPAIQLHVFDTKHPTIVFKDDYLDKRSYDDMCVTMIERLLNIDYENVAYHYQNLANCIHPEAFLTVKKTWEDIGTSYLKYKKRSAFYPKIVKADPKHMRAEVTGTYTQWVGNKSQTSQKTFILEHKHCGSRKYLITKFEEKS